MASIDPYPTWAKKFFGEEGLWKFNQIFELGKDFDLILEGCDRPTALQACRESQDMRVLSQLLVETCEALYARIKERTRFRCGISYVSRANSSMYQMVEPHLRNPQAIITHDIAMAMAIYMRDRAGLEMYVKERESRTQAQQLAFLRQDIARAREELETVPRPTGLEAGLDWDCKQTLGSWASLKLTLEKIQSLGAEADLPRLQQDDAALAEQLTLDLIDHSRVLKLQRLNSKPLFADSYNRYDIVLYPVDGYAESNLFADRAAVIIAVTNEPGPRDFFTRTGRLLFDRQSAFILNNAGMRALNAPTFVPVDSSPMGEKTRAFFHRFWMGVLLDLHEQHEKLFDSVERGEIETSRAGSNIHMPLPVKPRTDQPQSTEEQVVVSPMLIEEAKASVESHKRLRLHLPSLTANKILRSLHRLGCLTVRQTGSHILLQGPNGARRMIPQHNKKTIGIGSINKVLSAFGIDRSRFLEHL